MTSLRPLSITSPAVPSVLQLVELRGQKGTAMPSSMPQQCIAAAVQYCNTSDTQAICTSQS